MRIKRSLVRLIVLTAAVLIGVATCFAQHTETGLLGQGKPWETPYFITDSGVEGPTVVVTGGIHGNEPAGARAAEQIRHWPIVRGKLIVVPRVNPIGLHRGTRFLPEAPPAQRDLNRNFPSAAAKKSRGEIATELWKFIVAQNPDWLFDLHEGFEFHVSHQPQRGEKKSVGSSIIYNGKQGVGKLAESMLAAANRTVVKQDRKFVPLGRGPKQTTLAAAVIEALGKKAMILETTYQHQRLPVRTRQHRMMMNVALRQLGMIAEDCVHLLTPAVDKRHGHLFVALYDDAGASQRGVKNMTRVFDAAEDMTVVHLDANQIRLKFLSQFDAVVFGGGSGSQEAAAIGQDGADAVRRFVREGGGYVGVCAGAYLCSAHYSWSLNLIDTQVFTGKQEVPGQGLKSMWYRGRASLQKMQLTKEGQKLFPGISERVDVRYHNGPIVSPRNAADLKPYTVLAWFRSEKVLYPPHKGTMIDTPAMVRGKFGNGSVLSISPHPEATEGLRGMLPMAVRAVTRRPAAKDSRLLREAGAAPSQRVVPSKLIPAESAR